MMLIPPVRPIRHQQKGSFTSRTIIFIQGGELKIPSCFDQACDSNSVIPYSECITADENASFSRQ